jgi:protein-L-isoaspartate(D-aspartate) O-methyltransferase
MTTRPADIWLDRLNDGGRLILPLTSDKGFGENPENIPIQRRGAVFGIKRSGSEFLAKWISAVAIFPCKGARDAESKRALAAAFERGGWERVTRLYRTVICGTSSAAVWQPRRARASSHGRGRP